MTPYYQDDAVTLYHGDCRDVLPQIDHGAIVTDPPYGVRYDYRSYADRAGADYEALIAWLAWHVKHARWAFVTPGIANIWRWPPAAWVLCWHKPASTRRADLPQPDRPQGGFNEWEPILVYGRPRFMRDVYSLPASPQKDTGSHPCPKPLSLFRWLLGGAPAEDVILDPFRRQRHNTSRSQGSRPQSDRNRARGALLRDRRPPLRPGSTRSQGRGMSNPRGIPDERPLLLLRGVLMFFAVALLLGVVAASWVGDRIA